MLSVAACSRPRFKILGVVHFLVLGTRPEAVSFTCGATNTGCYHVDDTGVGKRNRIDPEHCNNQPLLARDTEAGRRPPAPD
jgi:hypothetical protein